MFDLAEKGLKLALAGMTLFVLIIGATLFAAINGVISFWWLIPAFMTWGVIQSLVALKMLHEAKGKMVDFPSDSSETNHVQKGYSGRKFS